LSYLSPSVIIMAFISPLTTWFQAAIQQVYDLKDTNFIGVLDAMFEDDASIILNHVPVSLKEYNDQFTALRAAAVTEVVEWEDIQDMPATDGYEGETPAPAPPTEQIIAGCYVVTRSLKFIIRGVPGQSKSHIVFSAKVQRLPDNSFKIKELFQTTIVKGVPIFPIVTNPTQ